MTVLTERNHAMTAHMTLDDLAAGLRAWATGSYSTEAAVELLIAHQAWLRRADFHEALIIDPDCDLIAIDWEHAVRIAEAAPASGSETRILQLAVSLAGQPVTAPLCDLIIGLDTTNTTHALNAIARCAGWTDRPHQAAITGCLSTD